MTVYVRPAGPQELVDGKYVRPANGIDCKECAGTGKVHSHNDKCWDCRGVGWLVPAGPVMLPGDPRPNTLWRHYKGGIYLVSAVAKHTTSGQLLVVYTDDQRRTWCRPLSEWFDDVGGVVRFTEIAK